MRLANAHVLDLATGESVLRDLWVRDGRLERLPTEDADEIDLDGRFVLPGLWDAHVHMTQWAMHSRRLDLSSARSAAQAADLVATALRTHPSTEPLLGAGFRDALWPDEPTAHLLDAVTGPHPVVLVSVDLHSVWANTAGLAHYGVHHPTGHLVEHDAFAFQTRLAEVSVEVIDGWVADAARDAASRGVVGVVDYEMAWNPEAWRRRIASGLDTLRVKAATYPLELDRAIGEGLHTGRELDDSGLLTMGPLKIIADGSLTARTAWCHSPYPIPGVNGPQGSPNYEWAELVDLVGRAEHGGLDCAIHAIGDRTAAMALDAFSVTGARGSIEHAQLLTPEDRGRMAALGLTASVQPAHLLDDRGAADTLWAGRTAGAFAYASLRDAGVPLVFGSDAPVAPLNPWLAVRAAVTRTGDDREPWHPEQRLSMSDSLAASTGGVRALVPGAPADLIALDVNPFDIDPERLSEIRTSVTMVAGHVTHRAH